MNKNDQSKTAGTPHVGSSAVLAGWSDNQCRTLAENLLEDEKQRCCWVKLHSTNVSGPCNAGITRYSHHEEKRFDLTHDACAWIDERWAMYASTLKPANEKS